MSDRKNFGHGQIVTETELDDAFNDLETADHDLSDDAGLSQNATTDAKDSTVYGGILSGLTVTRNGTNDYVTVAAGKACDDQGRRIYLPSNATVKITNIGDTTEAVVSSATGDGAAITVTCGTGQYVICSLYIVYDEVLSDARTDALGDSYYFENAESFHFHLKIGTAYSHPLGAPPTRGALEDGKVLIADLVLTNSGGAMQLVNTGGIGMDGILYSDENWDEFAIAIADAQYAGNTGRRSDWISLDDPTDFPLFDSNGVNLRQGTSRDSFYELVKMLQVTAATPSGGDLIGDRVHNAVTGSTIKAPASITLAAGSLHAKGTTISQYLADCLYKGGDNVITTDSAASGSLRIHSQYDTNQMYMDRYEYIVNNPAFMRGNYGEPIVGKRIEEHWLEGASDLSRGRWSNHRDATGGVGTTIVNGACTIYATAKASSSIQGVELGTQPNNAAFRIGTGNKYGLAGSLYSHAVLCLEFGFDAGGGGLPDTQASFYAQFWFDSDNYIMIHADFDSGNDDLYMNLRGGGVSETETLMSTISTSNRYMVHVSTYPQGTYDGLRGYACEIDTSTATITKQATVATSSDISLAAGGYSLRLQNNVTDVSDALNLSLTTYVYYLYAAETAIKRIANA